MGGLAKGLLGGGDDGGGAVSTQTVQVPSWLDSRNKNLVKRAETLSKQSFTPYTQQRIADFTTDANTAFDLTRSTTGKYNDLLNTTSSSVYDLISRANGPTSAQIQQYMNPYLENVLDISKRNTIDNYNDQQRLRDQEAGMINAFGGSRIALRQAEADELLQEQLQDLDYRGRFDAFDNAQNQFNRGSDVLSSGISQGLQTVEGGQAYNLADITQLLKQGELQRLRRQDELDFDFQEFDREQAYPYENINFLANIMNPLTGAYAGGTTTQDQQGGGGSSTLGNVAGIASSVASIAGLFSDERVKENIKQVGELDNGLPVYSYNYKGDSTPQIGLIAQDVEQVKPDAVGEVNGVKTVKYDEAVEMREGGPVSSNLASQARLAPVAPAGRASFPGISSSVPASGVPPEIDSLGLEALIEEFGLDDSDGNMLSRLFKGGLDGVDSSNYSAPIGPTLSPNSDGFFGLDSSGGSFLSAFGFADGGPVEGFRDKLDSLELYNLTQDTSPANSKAVNMVNSTGNALKNIPASILNELLAPVEGLEKGVRAAYPHVKDFLVTPEQEVQAKKEAKQQQLAKNAKAQYEEISVDDNLNEEIANLFNRGSTQENSLKNKPLTVADLKDFDESKIPALNANQLQMDDSGKVFKANSGVSYNRPVRQGNEFVASKGNSTVPNVLPPWITPINKEAGKTEEPRSKGINMPLLIAGLTMLGTDGDSGDKILAGLSAGTKSAGDAKRLELERQKAIADKKRQEFQDYIDYIKAQAYIEQVNQNARKGNGLTPYQAASLDLKRDKLDLEREKMEHKIKTDDDFLDPFADLDTTKIDEILAEMAE
jgi:hypothetical protein